MTKVHNGESPFSWRRGSRQDHVPPPPSCARDASALAPGAVDAAAAGGATQLQLELPLGAAGPSPEEAGHA